MVQFNVDFESLSDVLKNATRRRIILCIYEKGKISYGNLMNLVEITNTGKFNYHLKILGDLIEKDESGKYGLSEKGRLAVGFLQKFDKVESSLSTGENTFRTRAFSLFPGFIWLVLLYPVVGILLSLYLYFVGSTLAFRSDFVVPVIILSLFGVSSVVLFIVIAFPMIEIDRDGIVVNWGIGRMFFIFEEARVDFRGHILKLGEGWNMFGLVVPFKEKECMNTLHKRVETFRSNPYYLVYAIPTLVFSVLFAGARNPEKLLTPELWAIFFGFTTATSMTLFAYSSPVQLRIGGMKRGFSSVTVGIFSGIIISFLIYLGMQVF